MSIKTSIQTWLGGHIAANRGPLNRFKARDYGLETLLRRPPTLELYYQAGDPHSHLCAQWLRSNHARINLPIRIRMVPQASGAAYPEPERQRAMAWLDARRIAPAYGLHLAELAKPAAATACTQAGQRLAAVEEDLQRWLSLEETLIPALLHGEPIEGPFAPADKACLEANARRRERLGHYLPAMWQLAGDWFWGLDRLSYLEQAIRSWRGCRDAEALSHCNPGAYALPPVPTGTESIEFFFSFRSPYSYLAASRLQQLQDDLPLPLVIRPVLPMAMRGMKIPRAKGFYIVRDVYREATELNIPFGHFADPIGSGAERCLRVFTLADSPRQQLHFCQQAGTAIWSEAVDVAGDAGLRKVCERSGIGWSAAAALLAAPADLTYAEHNRQALLQAGAWGVPTFRVGDFVCWGNDRLPMLQELLKRGEYRH